MSAGGFSLPYTFEAPNGQNGRVNFSGPTNSAGGFLSQDPSVSLPKGPGLNKSKNSAAIGNGFLADAYPGFFQHQTTVEADFQNDMLRGNWATSPLSKAFFSADNVRNIQNALRKTVYEQSQPKGYVIDEQSVDELKIIMRAMYLQYSKNLPNDLVQQISELNQRVLDWSVPHILSAVDHYHYYIKDISQLPVPLARSVHMSSAGTKSLPLQPFM
jgi:hypothetical protein